MLSSERVSRAFVFAGLLITSLSFEGCSFVLPAHPRSLDTDSVLTVNFLTVDQAVEVARKAGHEISLADAAAIKNRLEESDIEILLQPRTQETPGAAIAVDILAKGAGLAAGLAVDFVKKQLEEEAARYEAGYSGTWSTDEYWMWVDGTSGKEVSLPSAVAQVKNGGAITLKLVPRYAGVLVSRIPNAKRLPAVVTKKSKGTTGSSSAPSKDAVTAPTSSKKADNNSPASPKTAVAPTSSDSSTTASLITETTPSLEYLVLMIPSRDYSAMKLKPWSFQQTRSKAKVLRSTFWFPWTYRWLTGTRQTIETKLDIDFISAYRDKEGIFHDDVKIASLEAGPYTTYLPGPKSRGPRELTGSSSLDSGYIGWVPMVPRSWMQFENTGGPFGNGLLSVRVSATERDTSKVKDYITRGATKLEENREKIVSGAENLIKPKEEDDGGSDSASGIGPSSNSGSSSTPTPSPTPAPQ